MWAQRIYQNAQFTFWFMDLRRSINFARFGRYFCLSPKCSFYQKVAFWAEPNAIFLKLFLICAFSTPKSANKRTLIRYIYCILKSSTTYVSIRAVNEPSRSWVTRTQLDKKLIHVCLFINKPSLSLSFRLV